MGDNVEENSLICWDTINDKDTVGPIDDEYLPLLM